jgi:alkylhydroperoxidase family enzyme
VPALADEEERAAVAASGSLHELPMLRGWLADEGVLRALAARLDAIAAGSPGEGEAARAAAQASAIAETVESWFDGARRSLLSSRLLAVAVHLASSGDEPRARQAAAVARALAAGTPARDVPFARQMVEKAFPSRGSATAPRAVPVISAPQR